MNPLLQTILFNRYTLIVAALVLIFLAFAGLRGCACLTQSIGSEDHEKTSDVTIPSQRDYESRKLPEHGRPDQGGKKR